MYAIIQAGGAGTRLKSITGDLPKSMVEIGGKPILEWQITSMIRSGISDFLLIISKNGQAIVDYFGSGSKWHINISYIKEDEPLGTGGGLFYAATTIKDDFILCFGDLMLDIDWLRLCRYHKDKKAAVTAFAHPNSHPFDSDVLVVDESNKILDIDSKGNVRDYYYENLTNAGLYVCSREVIDFVQAPSKIDFEKIILHHFVEEGKAYAYRSSEYVKDCGTPDRYHAVNNDLKNNIISSKSLINSQKAIFLDRDGTINRFGDFVKKAEDLVLQDDAVDSISAINRSAYLAICITNQPIVARGETTMKEMKRIHNKLEDELGLGGAYLDGLYFCPHHTSKGWPGEVPELKINCDCRKPKIGLLLKAKERFNIDLSKSWFVGDTHRDVQTGINAGCKTILLTCGDPEPAKYYGEAKPDYVCNSLAEATNLILSQEGTNDD